LIAPRISPDHIREKITCIRAHRERIFQVNTEYLHDKLICHNYGHGGAGWTFLFGCVNESIRRFEHAIQHNPALTNKPITVIGAGCHGLLTAILLARKGHHVTIIAKDVDALSSYKAAGFFFPRARKSSTPEEKAIFQALSIESYRTYLQIMQGDHPFIKSGPKIVPAYYGLDIDPGFAPYIEQGLMPTPEKVTIQFDTGKSYQAVAYQALFMNAHTLMNELIHAMRDLNITITRAHVQSYADIPTSIIFNTAGLGAKQLTHDARIVPIQGHLIALKDQPPTEHLQYMINVKVVMTNSDGKKRDELIYFAPKEEGILGITFIRGQDSLTANQHEFDRLLQRCADFFGSIEQRER
jgi:hypothetical protein